MADDPENPDQVEEEFSVWKKNTPFLYDLLISHPLEWPSLTVHWVPLSPVPCTADPTFGVHKLVLGTHTSGGATDFLMIAEAVLPTLEAESNIAGKNEDPVIPKVCVLVSVLLVAFSVPSNLLGKLLAKSSWLKILWTPTVRRNF